MDRPLGEAEARLESATLTQVAALMRSSSPSGSQLRLVVAMTTCDAQPFLSAQLESIAAQTRLPDCLVFSDDASTDATLAILDSFASNAPFPVVITRNPVRLGVRSNDGVAYTAACEQGADVIIPADDDDIWLPEKPMAAAEILEADESIALWCSDAEWIDADDARLGVLMSQRVHLHAQELEHGDGLARLVHGQTLSGGTMAFRRELSPAAVPFPEEMYRGRVLFDEDAWVAVLGRLMGGIAIDDRPLLLYRRYGGQLSDPTRTDAPDLDRVNSIRRHAAALTLIADRVRSRPDVAWNQRQVDLLFELEALYAVRAARRGSDGRWRAIARQVTSGAYARHTRGYLTAASDLLRPGR